MQTVTSQQISAVAQELVQRMERNTTEDQSTLVTKQTEEIHSLKNEIERMRLQQELAMKNVEAASTSSARELKSVISGLQNGVALEKSQRKNDLNWYKGYMQ